MEISNVAAIALQISTVLEKQSIKGTARIVDNHIDARYNSGHWLELKAVKTVNGKEFQFSGMIADVDVGQVDRSVLVTTFCAQAVHALENIA